MPFRFDINPDLNLLYVAAAERVTARQLARCVEAWPSYPTFYPGIDTLFDISENTKIELGGREAMDALAETVRAVRRQQSYRMACVVGRQEHETFFQAAMATLNPEAESRAFYERAEALAWLGHAGTEAYRLQQMQARIKRRPRREGL